MAEVTQAGMSQAELEALGVIWPPTEDELPYDDGMPMETQRHALQLQLLIDPLRLYWEDRQDAYVGGNMFIYFQPGTSAQSGLPRTGFFCGARRIKTRAQELGSLGGGQRARRRDRTVIREYR